LLLSPEWEKKQNTIAGIRNLGFAMNLLCDPTLETLLSSKERDNNSCPP
jgi:hypothetical protein